MMKSENKRHFDLGVEFLEFSNILMAFVRPAFF
jgi:hypothetical protein